MTDLKKLATVALNRAQESLTRTKSCGVVFLLGFADGSIKVQQVPDAMSELLNTGWGKDVLFEAMRRFGMAENAEAVVFCTECWAGKANPASQGLSREQWIELCRKYDTEELAQQGLIVRSEALQATAQTAEHVVSIVLPFRRDASGSVYSFGDQEIIDTIPADMEGRFKMFNRGG